MSELRHWSAYELEWPLQVNQLHFYIWQPRNRIGVGHRLFPGQAQHQVSPVRSQCNTLRLPDLYSHLQQQNLYR
jgi:hypothetical protein